MALNLKLENIVYSHKKNGFTLSIQKFSPAPCSAIIGENGSGKTTLGKIAAGIIRPTHGSVFYNEEDIKSFSLGRVGQQVGYIFQEPIVFAPNPLEEIAFPLILKGTSKKEADEIAIKLLEEFKLSHVKKSVTYTLSRGEKQRLSIAATLAARPKYLILDEPTTGLDKHFKIVLADILKNVLQKNIGLMIISHDENFVKELDAEIYVMKDGFIV